jgi:hypothetical protein
MQPILPREPTGAASFAWSATMERDPEPIHPCHMALVLISRHVARFFPEGLALIREGAGSGAQANARHWQCPESVSLFHVMG